MTEIKVNTNGSSRSEEVYSDILHNVVMIGRDYLFIRPSLFAEDASNAWREYSALQFKSTFEAIGYTKNAAEQFLCRLRTDNKSMYVSPKNVLTSYPLHSAGYQLINGTPFFIQNAWRSINPEKGSPEPVIRQLLRMFGNQTDIILGWLQGALMRQMNYRASIKGEDKLPYPPLASQTLCVCGGQGSGKTRVLLSCIIGELLGSYTAIPASWYNGNSKFGDWMLAAPVYVADDSEPLLRFKDRVAFASRLKSLGYPERFSCECKGKGAIDLTFPNERICLANIKFGAIESLPDTSIDGDKFLVLHIGGAAGWVEDYDGDFMRMDKDLRKSMPAFAHWLLNDYTIPEWAVGTASRRHAVMNLGGNRGYVAPAIRKAVAEIDRAGILMAKIRRVYYNGDCRGRWYNQSDMRAIIEAANKDAQILAQNEELSDLLRECCTRWPSILTSRRDGEGMKYKINYVPNFDAAMSISLDFDSVETWNQELLSLVGLTQQELEACFSSSSNVLQGNVDEQQNSVA